MRQPRTLASFHSFPWNWPLPDTSPSQLAISRSTFLCFTTTEEAIDPVAQLTDIPRTVPRSECIRTRVNMVGKELIPRSAAPVLCWRFIQIGVGGIHARARGINPAGRIYICGKHDDAYYLQLTDNEMSGAVVVSPLSTNMGLAGGLARCTGTPRRHADGAGLTTAQSEYGAPPPGTQRAQPIRPPPPASVMHRSGDMQCVATSQTQAVHAASGRKERQSTSFMASNMHATHLHISADQRLETRSTSTGDNFRPVRRMLPAAAIRKPAAGLNKFTHHCAGDEQTAAQPEYRSAFCAHRQTLANTEPRRRDLLTKNAGCCPITGIYINGC